MEERRNDGIDEAYFKTICEKLPFLQRLREDQKTTGTNYFALLIHFFKKFSELESDLRLDEDPQKRYELLFNIIEMGNLIDAMDLTEQCEIFLTLKRFRNVVADGYHAYSTKTSADIISAFQFFFKELGAKRPTQPFYQTSKALKESMYDTKDEFKYVNTRGDIYTFISSDGDKEAEKLKITALLQGIKYFLDKAAALYKEGKKECASLYFIAGANCGRDFENFFSEKIMRAKRLTVLEPKDTLELFAKKEEDRYIKYLLVNLRNLRQDRGQQFAHKYGKHKAATDAAMQKKISGEREAKDYIARIYGTIDVYLQKEYGIRPTMAAHTGSIKITDDSPRPYIKAPATRRGEIPPRTLFFPEESREAKKPQEEKKRHRDESDRRRDIPTERDKNPKQHRKDRSPTRK